MVRPMGGYPGSFDTPLNLDDFGFLNAAATEVLNQFNDKNTSFKPIARLGCHRGEAEAKNGLSRQTRNTLMITWSAR